MCLLLLNQFACLFYSRNYLLRNQMIPPLGSGVYRPNVLIFAILLAQRKTHRHGGLIIVFACTKGRERLLDGLASWWVCDGLQAFSQPSGEFLLGVSVCKTDRNRHTWIGQ